VSHDFTYVYILTSISHPNRHYTGMTCDLQNRLHAHNAGKVSSTAGQRPWRIETVIAFSRRDRAVAFEKYPKSHSGMAFSSKHF
jgi:predicted GIY-YIG superfamily endonuclease